MGCPCEHNEKQPKKCGMNTPPVLEIKSEECPVLFHTVNITAEQGDKDTLPPTYGAYKNTRVYYEANKMSYLYDSDGVPQVLSGTGADGVASVNGQAGDVIISPENIGAATTEALADEASTRQEADSTISESVTSLSDKVEQNTADIATKANADDVYTQSQINDMLAKKADAGAVPATYWGQTSTDGVVSGNITLNAGESVTWGDGNPSITGNGQSSMMIRSGVLESDESGQYTQVAVGRSGLVLDHYANGAWERKAKISGVDNGVEDTDAVNVSQIKPEGWTSIGNNGSRYNKAGNVVTLFVAERKVIGTTVETAFTLPEGYRPNEGLINSILINDQGTLKLGFLYVNANGDVQLSTDYNTSPAYATIAEGTITFIV